MIPFFWSYCIKIVFFLRLWSWNGKTVVSRSSEIAISVGEVLQAISVGEVLQAICVGEVLQAISVGEVL